MDVIGLKGDLEFEALSEIFLSNGVDAVIMDPMHVFSRSHVTSAMQHAERSFRNGTNRSRTLTTEFLLYIAGERQISRAILFMKPKNGQKEFVVLLLNGVDDNFIKKISMERCDEIIDGTEEKASALGLKKNGMNVSYEDLVLELVAMTDILKN